MNVTIASVVKDVEQFLPQSLECWESVGDRVRVIDNGSSDGTLDLLRDAADRHPDFRWASCTIPMDGNEWQVRRELFEYAADGADWLVHLDADHTVASDFREHLRGNAALFRVYDMWSQTHYRSDRWWTVRPWWRALRVGAYPKAEWEWSTRGWHSGHLPSNVSKIVSPTTIVPHECSVLHWGYATPELRAQHHEAYMNRAAHLTDPEIRHAMTIIDPEPRTKELPFTVRWTIG